MLVKILGVIDMVAAIVLFLIGLGLNMANPFLTVLAIILLVKSLFIFTGSFASIFDLYAGILLLLSITFTIPKFFIIIAVFLLLQKGFLSLVG